MEIVSGDMPLRTELMSWSIVMAIDAGLCVALLPSLPTILAGVRATRRHILRCWLYPGFLMEVDSGCCFRLLWCRPRFLLLHLGLVLLRLFQLFVSFLSVI